jgi:Archaeal flavoproteins
MRIAWAFTGAGHLLLESVEELEKLAREHKVTIMISRAAEEVLKMYGLFERVKN